MKRLIALCIATLLLAGCASTPVTSRVPVATSTPAAPQLPWWNTTVFYEVFVRSFYDSNGDGIGDFNGLTQKLDYLNDGKPASNTSLGVNGIWLMPINPSPTYHGYDVTDYYGVNPAYGTMDDFKRLLAEAHKRGIKVIIDLVLNHTSSQNPWFVQAESDPKSPYRSWYLWSDTNPGYAGPFGVAWHPSKSGFYYGIFDASMPDLNYTNPAVTAEMEKVVRFWLNDVGVDGFRIDAAKHLIEEGQKQENTQSTHDWYKAFYKVYKADNPNAFTIGEVAGSSARLVASYTGDQMDMVFNFELASGMVNSARGEASSSVTSAIKFVLKDMPSWQFGTFLTNHDQNRVMSMLDGSVDRAKVAASLLLTIPGVPFIYYGEEIGLQGQKPDEDIRRPMQWSADPNAGFSAAAPWRALGPAYEQANVAAETNDPNSLLNHYRALIALRAGHPALQSGGLALLSSSSSGVYAILRTSPGENLLVLINLTKSAISDYNLSSDGPVLTDGTYHLVALFGSGPPAQLAVAKGSFTNFKPAASLSPYSTTIYQLKP